MSLLTLIQYLLGGREAILRVARAPQALGLGLLFVLAAGFAREYDGEDLLHEPWHLFIPLAASVVSSAVLYSIVRGIARLRGVREPSVLRGYREFLGLYWMTAPLALLYAVPFEQFLDAESAAWANVFLLALVATWRVLLIARVISVLFDANYFAAWFIVMLFADSLLLLVISLSPVPPIQFMGGIRDSPGEIVITVSAMLGGAAAVLTWPIWFIGVLIVVLKTRPPWHYQSVQSANEVRVSRPLWMLGGFVLGAWVAVLPFSQRQQLLRHRVETHLRAGQIPEAMELMSAHAQSDFPRYWDPPPRIAYLENTPNIMNVQEYLDENPVKPWVRAIFVDKFSNWLGGPRMFEGRWIELTPAETETCLGLIERMPERNDVVRENEHEMNRLLVGDALGVDLQERVRKLLKEADVLHVPYVDAALDEQRQPHSRAEDNSPISEPRGATPP